MHQRPGMAHGHALFRLPPRDQREQRFARSQTSIRLGAFLFFSTPDPTPANQQFLLQQEQSDLRNGVRTINEVRTARGLAPVVWGDKPK